jgi:hypothetical protein
MLRISSLFSLLACLVLAASSVVAGPMNKCLVNGTVTYQQGSCPSDQARTPPTVQELNAREQRKRAAAVAASPEVVAAAAPRVSRGFHCDGRQYCPQMKSCAEARYFLAHCPGVKMDGNHDGIPCERQWCGN